MYAYIIDNKVRELIPDIDPVFPGLDITERYPSETISKFVHVEDDANVKCGMNYDHETGTFSEPDVPVISLDIDALKVDKVEESKTKLAEWLSENPMTYTDGKSYTATAEKQALLNSNLASYERAKAAGVPYPLKWNASGEECIEWEYDDLVALSLAIAAYVAPKVSEQQTLEITINACQTPEELDKININYA